MKNNLIRKIVPGMVGLIALAGCSVSDTKAGIGVKPKYYPTFLEQFCVEDESDDSYNGIVVVIPENKANWERAREYIKNNQTENCLVRIGYGPGFKGLKTGDILKGFKVIRPYPVPDFMPSPEEPKIEKVPKKKFIMA